jgi:Mn-containing catalase
VKEKYEKHLEWLRPLDNLTRATKGFESGIDYMMRRDNAKDLQQFKDAMKKLDVIRDENMLETFPELRGLYETN